MAKRMKRKMSKKKGIGATTVKGAVDVTDLQLNRGIGFIPEVLSPKKKRR